MTSANLVQNSWSWTIKQLNLLSKSCFVKSDYLNKNRLIRLQWERLYSMFLMFQMKQKSNTFLFNTCYTICRFYIRYWAQINIEGKLKKKVNQEKSKKNNYKFKKDISNKHFIDNPHLLSDTSDFKDRISKTGKNWTTDEIVIHSGTYI